MVTFDQLLEEFETKYCHEAAQVREFVHYATSRGFDITAQQTVASMRAERAGLATQRDVLDERIAELDKELQQ